MRLTQLFLYLVFLCSTLTSQTDDQLKKRADSLFTENNFKGSLKVVENLLLKYPNNYDLKLHKIMCLYYDKQYFNCINHCNSLLNTKPNFNKRLHILEIRGDSYYNSNKFTLAYKDYQECLKFNESASILSNVTFILYSAKKYNEAIAYAKRILLTRECSSNDKINAYEYIGICNYHLDSLNIAVDAFNSLLNIDSNSIFALTYIANISLLKEDYLSSIKYATKALLIDSNTLSALTSRGTSFLNLGQYKKSLIDFYKFESLGAKNRYLYSSIATAELELKNYETAIKYYKIQLKKEPKSSETHNQMAWTYFLMKQYLTALSYSNKAIALDSKSSYAYDTRGAIYYKLNKTNLSIKDLNTAIRLDQSSANSYYYRGLNYLSMNNMKEACKDWQKTSTFIDYTPPENEESIKNLMNKYCH